MMADRFVIVEPSSGGADLSEFPYIIKEVVKNRDMLFNVSILFNPEYIDDILNECNLKESTQTDVFKNFINQIKLINRMSTFPYDGADISIRSTETYGWCGMHGDSAKGWYLFSDNRDRREPLIDEKTGFYIGSITDSH